MRALMSGRTASRSRADVLGSLISDFVCPLRDHFNPMLQAVEELLGTAGKRDKK